MKAHEIAKKLNINMKTLSSLFEKGHIKSPNQELSDEENVYATNKLNNIQLPESQNFPSDDVSSILMVGVDKNTCTAKCLRLTYKTDGSLTQEIVEERSFHSNEQAFSHADYLLAKVEFNNIK